eukprot:gb/GECH01011458.1/.p1 GENE.gb/GECH01011458.1/~~gb/GECH01011458.1/.p1  ORF type:complete len:415 (+),score=76.47 gb/GECH01011458.1/:1-1245(+)
MSTEIKKKEADREFARKNFSKAFSLYSNILGSSNCSELQQAKLCKNSALCCYKYSLQTSACNAVQWQASSLINFSLALHHFAQLSSEHSNHLGQNWKLKVLCGVDEVWSQMKEKLDRVYVDDRERIISDVIESCGRSNLKRNMLVLRGQVNLKRAFLEQSDETALDMSHQIHKDLAAISQYEMDETTKQSMKELEDEYKTLVSKLEAALAMKKAEWFLHNNILEATPLPSNEQVYQCIDYFSRVYTIDDSEKILAAKCHGRIGRLYQVYLKDHDKARKHFRDCVTLAQSANKTLDYSVEWLTTARNALEEYQRLSVLNEEERENEEKALSLVRLDPIIKKLDSRSNTLEQLITHLYRDHKSGVKSVDTSDDKTAKKNLKEVIKKYREQNAKDKDERVLFERIRMKINQFYEKYK